MTHNITRILALRHGETAWNVDTRIQGQIDIGLNTKGRWQALRLAQALRDEPLDALYASDLSRAQDTAQAIAHTTGLSVRSHAGLRERAFGVFEGKTYAEIEVTWPTESLQWRRREPGWAAKGGESLQALRERVLTTVNNIAQHHPGQNIALVAHGGVLDQLYRAATGQDLQTPRTWVLGNAAINRLLWTPEGLRLVGWADSQHLDEDIQFEPTA